MNLQLATSEELVAELFTRYPDAAFVGMKEHPHDPESMQCYQRFQGHTIIVQGLLTKMIAVVQQSERYPHNTEADL